MQRRAFCPLSAPVFLFLLGLSAAFGTSSASAFDRSGEAGPEKLLVYVGTYTSGASEGIYVFEMDLADGRLSPVAVVRDVENPSFLALYPGGRFLYAVNEISRYEGEPVGTVSAFRIDPQTGGLTFLNRRSSRGAGPCHLDLDRDGSHVLVANYGGGSVAALPIGDDGRLGEATGFVQHEGSSVNPQRQRAPHAHSILVDPSGRFACSADLGIDKVLVYRFDSRRGTLTPNDPPAVSVAPGAGPRHFAFHPEGPFAYVINELNSTLTAFSWDARRGALEELHTVSTLPEGFDGNNSTAEVLVHPSGRFVYGSNRGHDSIAIFAIDRETGRVRPAGHQPTGGRTPRNFGIDPTGRYLLAANQASDTVVVFRIDQETGALEPTGVQVEVPTPVCVRMLPRR